MAKKLKSTGNDFSPAGILAELEAAIAQQKIGLALELAWKLHRGQPSEESLQRIKKLSLAFADQIRIDGGTSAQSLRFLSDASGQIDPENQDWLNQLIGKMLDLGGIEQALALVSKLPDWSPLHPSPILNQLIDHSMVHPTRFPSGYFDGWKEDIVRVVNAFRLVHAGQDAEAILELQGVGLRSPLLEWKLLLRGLIAYYQGDNSKAVENWQRLKTDRIPARLAAPYRQSIDPPFRRAQEEPIQKVLRSQFNQLRDSSLIDSLVRIQKQLHEGTDLEKVLRFLKKIVPDLKRQFPRMIPRIANIFYWSLLDHGPDDIPDYVKTLGHPPEDPQFNRLTALALEKAGRLDVANQYWANYAKEIEKIFVSWAPEQIVRAKALIHLRMAKNLVRDSGGALAVLQAAFRIGHPEPEDLKEIEQNLVKAIRLGPDLLEAYQLRLDWMIREGNSVRAIKAARELLKQFPDHAKSTLLLADLLLEHQSYSDAEDVLREGIRINPLHQEYREKLADILQRRGRIRALQGEYRKALADYQAGLEIRPARELQSQIMARMAVCHLKLGNQPEADPVMQMSYQQASSQPAHLLLILTETVSLKLARTFKTQLEKEWKTCLEENASMADLTAQMGVLRKQVETGGEYTGYKTHLKLLAERLEEVFEEKPLEGAGLINLCQELCSLGVAMAMQNRYLKLAMEDPRSASAGLVLKAEQVLKKKKTEASKADPVVKYLIEAESMMRFLDPEIEKQQVMNRMIKVVRMLVKKQTRVAGPLFSGDGDYE